jgi:hypothetical protein
MIRDVHPGSGFFRIFFLSRIRIRDTVNLKSPGVGSLPDAELQKVRAWVLL